MRKIVRIVSNPSGSWPRCIHLRTPNTHSCPCRFQRSSQSTQLKQTNMSYSFELEMDNSQITVRLTSVMLNDGPNADKYALTRKYGCDEFGDET